MKTSIHFRTAPVKVLTALCALAALGGCGFSSTLDDGTPGTWSAREVAGYFPSLAHLPATQLDGVLEGIPEGDDAAFAELVRSTGADSEAVEIDTTVSTQAVTVRQIRAAWARPVVAPFGDISALIGAGRLDEIPPVPAMTLTAREIASPLECRASRAPWATIDRAPIEAFPQPNRNGDVDTYLDAIASWVHGIAATETEVLASLDAWTAGVPRHADASDPWCSLDQAVQLERDQGVLHPRVAAVSDWLVAGETDASEIDLAGARITAYVLCDVAENSTEDPRSCDDTRTAVTERLAELNAADPAVLDASVLFAGGGDEPDRALLTSYFSGLDEAGIRDLITEPATRYFQEQTS